jgi:Zn-finger nucleic acid-binding protein
MLKCTTCNVPLCRIEYEGVPIEVCPECGGSLVDAMRFKGMERRQAHAPAVPDEPAFADQPEASPGPPRRCSKCLAPMVQVPVRLGGGVVTLGYCQDCDAIWFDRGGLDRARALARKDHELRAADRDEAAGRSALWQLPRKPEPAVKMDLLIPPHHSVEAGMVTPTEDNGWLGNMALDLADVLLNFFSLLKR